MSRKLQSRLVISVKCLTATAEEALPYTSKYVFLHVRVERLRSVHNYTEGYTTGDLP